MLLLGAGWLWLLGCWPPAAWDKASLRSLPTKPFLLLATENLAALAAKTIEDDVVHNPIRSSTSAFSPLMLTILTMLVEASFLFFLFLSLKENKLDYSLFLFIRK